jgi:hypothetical protein
MKKTLLLFFTVCLGATLYAQTPYAHFPYNDGAPFVMPTDKVEADLDGVWDASWVVLGSHFDKSATGVTGLLDDLTKTYTKGGSGDAIVIGDGNGWTPPRTISDVAGTSVAGTGLRWRPDSKTFDNTAYGGNYYFTVSFTESAKYNFFLRKRGGDKGDYSIFVYELTNMDAPLHTITFNAEPLKTSTAFGTNSNDGTCMASNVAVTGADNSSSNWIKVKTPTTIAAGTYVVRVNHKGASWAGAFGGFVFLKEPASTKPDVSMAAPTNNSYYMNGDKDTLRAQVTASAGRTISSVTFFNGATNIGSGVFNSENSLWELVDYTLPTGKSTITAVAKDDANEENTTLELFLFTAKAATGAYVTRTSWEDRIEAEDFDYGGADVAFKDFSTQSGALRYRDDSKDQGAGVDGAVQLENANSNRSNGANVCWSAAGDWMNYTIPDVTSSYIDIAIMHANPGDQSVKISLNNTVIGTYSLTASGGWFTFTETVIPQVDISAALDGNSDDDVLTFEFVTGNLNLDYLKLTHNVKTNSLAKKVEQLSAFASGAEIQITGSVSGSAKAEMFDLSGKVIASFNLSESNHNTLNVSSLTNGIYILRVTDGSIVDNFKLVLKK